jgi:hypothetical protein
MLPVALGIVLLVDWVLFIRLVVQSETPYGAYYHTSGSTAILLTIPLLAFIASRAAPAGRWQLSLASVLLVSLWVGIGYAPAHWLTRVDFGRVSIDNHPVPASVYFGRPTDSEAEAVALVRIQDGGDYFLDFGSEKVRQGSRSEYVRLVGGVWCFRSMQTGSFVEPLPSRKMNQFRILSHDGHLITVEF